MSTPCKSLGYEIGDTFEIIHPPKGRRNPPHCFEKGTKVTLLHDDGSHKPAFFGMYKGDKIRQWVHIDEVKKVDANHT